MSQLSRKCAHRGACPAQAAYFAFRVFYLWASFSGWHMLGLALLLTVHAACWLLLSKSATPLYAPLEKGGALISGGEDLDQKGVIEYTWDMLYMTLFVQLTTGFVSDWFWLLYTASSAPARAPLLTPRAAARSRRLDAPPWQIPPCIGLYYLWIKVVYPWIATPDEAVDQNPMEQKSKVKYGKGR